MCNDEKINSDNALLCSTLGKSLEIIAKSLDKNNESLDAIANCLGGIASSLGSIEVRQQRFEILKVIDIAVKKNGKDFLRKDICSLFTLLEELYDFDSCQKFWREFEDKEESKK